MAACCRPQMEASEDCQPELSGFCAIPLAINRPAGRSSRHALRDIRFTHSLLGWGLRKFSTGGAYIPF